MIIMIASMITMSRAELMPKVRCEVQSTVTMLEGNEVSSRTWKPNTNFDQHEIVIEEIIGHPTLIRLTEFE